MAVGGLAVGVVHEVMPSRERLFDVLFQRSMMFSGRSQDSSHYGRALYNDR